MEQSISSEVQERLNNINWDNLKDRYGISRDSLTPAIATQLAYGMYTDLIPGSTEELSGMFSLRAFPQEAGQDWKIKVYTMEKPKSIDDAIFLYKQPITSEAVKKALFERTSWEGNDGTTKKGLANANGGYPVTIEVKGKKEKFLVSIHQPTNRVVGMPVEQVKAFFLDREGASRGKSMYGVQFTKEQIDALSEGKATRMDGCRTKDGEVFSCYVQFDAAQRTVVPCHPAWIKEAQKAGTDLGLGKQKPQEKQEAKASQEVKAAKQNTPKVK